MMKKSSESYAVREITRARYSVLNWGVETRQLLLSEIDHWDWGSTLLRPQVIPREPCVIQLNLHSDLLFTPVNLGQRFESESPAALVVSIHPNGSVCFSASGLSSSYTALPRGSYTLGLYASANELAGEVGRQRIRRHLADFQRLAYISMTEVAPDRKSSKFISRLENRTQRFRSVFATLDDERRARVTQNVALAGGLAAGLISSAILPLLHSLGSDAKQKAAEVLRLCKEVPGHLECMKFNDYHYYRAAGDFVSSENLLLVSLFLAGAALLVVRRYINR